MSEEMPIPCESCGKILRLTDVQLERYQGKKVKCPECGQPIAIPLAVGLGAAAEKNQPLDFSIAPPPPPPPVPAPPPVGSGGSLHYRSSGATQGQPDFDAEARERFSRTAEGSRGTLSFEGSFTPALALLPEEQILDVFEASAWDLGLFGWLFGYKKRMLLTNFRLIHFEKRILTNAIEVIWLPRVIGAAVGQGLRPVPFAAGVFMILMGLLGLLGSLIGGAGSIWNRRADEFGTAAMQFIVFGIMCAVGLFLIISSRIKMMLVYSADGRATGLQLIRIQKEESKRFCDRVFEVIHQNPQS